MPTGTQDRILLSALEVLRHGGAVTLESTAVESGLTKPGLMYHFPSKEALMLGLVDFVIDGWERELEERLSVPLASAPIAARIRAYVDYALEGEFDVTDIVLVADPRLRDQMSARWNERTRTWFDMPDTLEPETGAVLTAVRLLADGAWFAQAADVMRPSADERRRIRLIAHRLLETAE